MSGKAKTKPELHVGQTKHSDSLRGSFSHTAQPALQYSRSEGHYASSPNLRCNRICLSSYKVLGYKSYLSHPVPSGHQLMATS